jgi:hypothetical protein
MIRTFMTQLLSITLAFLLVTNTGPFEAEGHQSPTAVATGYSEQPAHMSTNELQQLAAPIALYPDALIAQVLGAATLTGFTRKRVSPAQLSCKALISSRGIPV